MTPRKEVIGDCELWLGDCREVLPTLDRIDAVVTDPPYGIDFEYSGGMTASGGWHQFEKIGWDQHRPDKEVLLLLLTHSKHQIIWGGNYFTDILPPTMQWLIWDKGQRDFSLGDFEMAWSSQQRGSRIIAYSRAQALRDGKEHPTQKPIAVMAWCLKQLPSNCRTIFDPYMGSGSTGVACVILGKCFFGCELEPRYFDIACRRIEAAYRQPDLFLEHAKRPAPTQAPLFEVTP